MENKYIEVLGLPTWDKKVKAMIDEMGLEHPDSDYMVSMQTAKKFNIDFHFDDDCETDAQKAMVEQGNLYLQAMNFKNVKDLDEAPFDIKVGDSYEIIVKKIGIHATYRNVSVDDMMHWVLKKSNNEAYLLGVSFDDDSLESCWGFSIATYNKEFEYEFRENELAKK